MDKGLRTGFAGLGGLLLLGMGWLHQQAIATERALTWFERSSEQLFESSFESSEPSESSLEWHPSGRRASRWREVSQRRADRSDEAFVDTMLASHNRYRTELNLPPLRWSDQLAQNAQGWADELAARGGRRLEHSQGTGEGENLWMGTSGYFSYDDMVTGWGDEKRYFRLGTFPNVSTTGNWADVGHYTQIIWRNTTHVGCALSTAGGNDILVCRYSPPGNYSGRRVY
ncbi:CAP family protein [Thermoleptolyngbya sp. C42_A2020_037]|uniref:CAP family protein n=1 Tax=Thermoleptolyngbya sp. C42_A2020_037 TaxID=2747799 RepID=UPI0025F1DF1C|nr:CAP family protein [Thermoleptolyngbya sp. C42_A2020_037]